MRTLYWELILIIAVVGEGQVKKLFLEKIQSEDGLTRDENKKTHFCVYFAAHDPNAKKVFLGHHKKSGFWLFNGGHIDKDETAREALMREMQEEWGCKLLAEAVPNLLTITEINNPEKQTCTRHYDIWYFVETFVDEFKPDRILLEKEFSDTGWYNIAEAKKLTNDPATLEALNVFEKIFNS